MTFWDFLPPFEIRANFKASEMKISNQIKVLSCFVLFCSVAAKIFCFRNALGCYRQVLFNGVCAWNKIKGISRNKMKMRSHKELVLEIEKPQECDIDLQNNFWITSEIRASFIMWFIKINCSGANTEYSDTGPCSEL